MNSAALPDAATPLPSNGQPSPKDRDTADHGPETVAGAGAAQSEISHFDVRPYDGAAHQRFVFDSFSKSQRRPRSALRRALMRPGVRVFVATLLGDSDSFLGWIAAVPGENRIVYVYTKHALRRRPGEESPFRIASSLAIAAGVDFSRPVPCSFWGRVPRRIVAAGNAYNLRHAPEVVIG